MGRCTYKEVLALGIAGGMLLGVFGVQERAFSGGNGPPSYETTIRIQRGLAETVQLAASKQDLPDLVSTFAESDARRLTDIPGDAPEIDLAVEQLRDTWRERFDGAFHFPSALTAGTRSDLFGRYQFSSESTRSVNVLIPGEENLAEATLHMVSDDGGRSWRLDIPDEIDSTVLVSRLTEALNALKEDHAAWPDDEIVAYRLAAHRILLAIGVERSASTG